MDGVEGEDSSVGDIEDLRTWLDSIESAQKAIQNDTLKESKYISVYIKTLLSGFKCNQWTMVDIVKDTGIYRIN